MLYWKRSGSHFIALFFFLIQFIFLLLRNGHCTATASEMQRTTYHGLSRPVESKWSASDRTTNSNLAGPTWTTTMRQLLDQVSPSLYAMNDCFIGLPHPRRFFSLLPWLDCLAAMPSSALFSSFFLVLSFCFYRVLFYRPAYEIPHHQIKK